MDVKETVDKDSHLVSSVMEVVAPTSSNGQGKSKEDRKFLDVGVLRFPDISHPFLRVRDLNRNLVREFNPHECNRPISRFTAFSFPPGHQLGGTAQETAG
jgi:hypothetical protein